MAKAILDIFIEAGYPYAFIILEADYDCYFECESIGQLQFSVVSAVVDSYELLISKEDTNKLLTTLEEYTVYTVKISDGAYSQLLSGRIHVDDKVRS